MDSPPTSREHSVHGVPGTTRPASAWRHLRHCARVQRSGPTRRRRRTGVRRARRRLPAAAAMAAPAPGLISVFSSPQELGASLAQLVAQRAASCLEGSRGRFALGLSGGSLVSMLARDLPAAAAPAGPASLARWTLGFCDERLVPFEHAESTYGLYRVSAAGARAAGYGGRRGPRRAGPGRRGNAQELRPRLRARARGGPGPPGSRRRCSDVHQAWPEQEPRLPEATAWPPRAVAVGGPGPPRGVSAPIPHLHHEPPHRVRSALLHTQGN